MNKKIKFVCGAMLLIICCSIYLFVRRAPSYEIGHCRSVERPARIRPDCSGCIIPPDIAPLNFTVNEDAQVYCLKVSAEKGRTITRFSKTPDIKIPMNEWGALLRQNKGQPLHYDIYTLTEEGWQHFEPFVVHVANEEIDSYLVYRKIHPGFQKMSDVGIYQRDLSSYSEAAILENSSFSDGCVNCHSFCNNEPDRMLLAIRSKPHSSHEILATEEEVSKIGTKFGYTSWHPSGRIAAYSLNSVHQVFHSARPDEVRDAFDTDSMIAYYSFADRQEKTSEHLSRQDRLETYPCFSPDGKHLYFSSAEKTWESRPDQVSVAMLQAIKYDIMRLDYDIDTDTFSNPQVIVSAEKTGKSSILPRISPDGRFLVFCMCDYGAIPAVQPSSDLYIIDLSGPAEADGGYASRRLDMNSGLSESWHSFSKNGRWLAFSSKRYNGTFTRTYLSYLDADGVAGKPFLLPQRDASFYDSCLRAYNTPELISGRVGTTREKIGRVIRGPGKVQVDTVTRATPKTGSGDSRYNERE